MAGCNNRPHRDPVLGCRSHPFPGFRFGDVGFFLAMSQLRTQCTAPKLGNRTRGIDISRGLGLQKGKSKQSGRDVYDKSFCVTTQVRKVDAKLD